MGDRGDVGDRPHLEPSCLEGTDSRLAPWAGPLNEDIKLPNPMLHRLPSRQMSSHLGSIGRALPRALKTRCPSTPPSDGVALLVGDGDYSVIESSLNMRLRVRDVLALPPPPGSALPPWHSKPPLTIGHRKLLLLSALGATTTGHRLPRAALGAGIGPRALPANG